VLPNHFKHADERGKKIRVKKMKTGNLDLMSTDELWSLHEEVTRVLSSKLAEEMAQLEGKMKKLGAASPRDRKRRPYPPVLPKYRNPAHPSETWAGRGKQPRWLSDQLSHGKKLNDFRIRANGH
jgi:DNA-binding protein H-NS